MRGFFLISMIKINTTNKYIKAALKITGLFVLLVVLLFFIAAAYIHFNKDSIAEKIKSQIDSAINGSITIADLDVSLLSTFPNAAVNLEQVAVLDTQYHKPLLQAAVISVRINIFQLLKSNPDIAKLVISNSKFDLFTDSNGYSNASIFAKKKTGKAGNASSTIVRKVVLQNFEVSIANDTRKKLYAFTFKELSATIDREDSLLQIKLDEECFIKGLGFNLPKGSYLQNQTLEAKNWQLTFNTVTQDIYFDKSAISINNHQYDLEGRFHFKDSSWFRLHVVTKDVRYKVAAAILTEKIQKKLFLMDLEKPIDLLEADISGPLEKRSDPYLTATFTTKNNDITTPVVSFNNCSFTGKFDNHISDSLDPDDENTKVIFNNFKASWGDIPLTTDSIVVSNLADPIIKFNFQSQCTFKQLDDQLALQTISFTGGDAQLSLHYDGPLIPDASLLSKLTANIKIENGTLVYEPRNLSFINCNGNVSISENNISVDRLTCDIKQNHFEINIAGFNVNKLAQKDSGKTFIACNVFTPSLDLGDFKAAFSSQKTVKKRKGTSKLASTALQIDNLLEKGDMQLNLKAKQIQLDNFTATNAETQLLFQQDDWEVQKAYLQHAGGSLNVSGKIHQVNPSYHEANATLNLKNVDVRKVFYAFGNFGQDGMSYTNLRGKMNTDAKLTLGLNNKGKVVNNSMKGIVDFSIKNGALINYAPIQEIGKSFLKNRDLTNVTFAELKDRLSINGNLIQINRMEIASSALTMYVEGVYSFKEGTDISIQIPLSNLKNVDTTEAVTNKGTDAKVGPSIYLRAKDGVSGKVKIGVDVLRMFRKKKKS